MSIFFRADPKKKTYMRQDYDLLTYLGDIGGLLDFVMMFGWSISTIFVTRLFQASLVERVYRLQRYVLDMTPYYKTRVLGQPTPPDSSCSTPDSDSSDSSSDKSSSSSSSLDGSEKEPTPKRSGEVRMSRATVGPMKLGNDLMNFDM